MRPREIRIKRRYEPPLASGKAKRGVLPDRREAEILARRRRPGIKFYDMGRKWNGMAFADFVTTHVDPAYLFDDSADHAFFKATVNPSLSDFDDLRAEVIDYAVADIEAKHPRIDEFAGEYFDTWLGSPDRTASGDPEWSDNGWNVSQSDLDAMTDFSIGGSDRLVESAILTGSSKNHITSVYNPAAAAVSYSPRRGDKFFLMPALVRPEGYVMYQDLDTNHGGSLGSTISVVAAELYDSQVIPRVPLLDSAGPYYIAGLDRFQWSGTDGSVPNYTENFRTLEFFQSFAVGRNRNEAANDTTFFTSFAWRGSYVGSGFPPSSFFSSSAPPGASAGSSVWMLHAMATFGTLGSQELTGIADVAGWTRPSGTLLAVIKQGLRIFYVWK